jgi:CopG family nickel-responsive transcriptional regulator
MDHDMCLEVLIVRWKAKEVSALSDRIKATKGVKHGELVVTRVNY